MICLQLFHIVAQSHQISKHKGDSTGHKQEVCSASSAHPPPCQPQSCTPNPGQGDGVHEDALPKWRPLPRAAASYPAGPATPTALLSPGVPRLLLTLQPPGPEKAGQRSCQPGNSGEPKTTFANTAEITGFISRHMAVSSGREEGTAGLLAKFLVFLDIYMLCISGFCSPPGCLLWQDDAAWPEIPSPEPLPCSLQTAYDSLLPALSRTANKKLAFFNASIKHHSLPAETTTEIMESLGEKEPITQWCVSHPCSDMALKNCEGQKHESIDKYFQHRKDAFQDASSTF